MFEISINSLPPLTQHDENEEIPENLKDIFGRKLGDTISDHSAQSSICSEPDSNDDSMPNEELTRVLGLLSEEQAKSRALQQKLDSMEKQLGKGKELEKELEKTKGKVSELNRRFEDATRAYEQEKRVSCVLFCFLGSLAISIDIFFYLAALYRGGLCVCVCVCV